MIEMFDLFVLGILLAAFITALIDTSLGMGYGTILSPILLIMEYPPEVVVPTILFSQLIVDIASGITHISVKNFTRKDVKVTLYVTIPAISFVILGVFLNINLPSIITKIYIGLIVTIFGLLLLLGKRFKKTSKRIIFLAFLAGFNKGFMGGGFGPIIVPGQITLKLDVRPSISIASIAEAPVCITGLLVFLLLNKLSFLSIYLIVTIPALIGSLIGPRLTKKITGKKNYAEKIIGGLTVTLGFITLLKELLKYL